MESCIEVGGQVCAPPDTDLVWLEVVKGVCVFVDALQRTQQLTHHVKAAAVLLVSPHFLVKSCFHELSQGRSAVQHLHFADLIGVGEPKDLGHLFDQLKGRGLLFFQTLFLVVNFVHTGKQIREPLASVLSIGKPEERTQLLNQQLIVVLCGKLLDQDFALRVGTMPREDLGLLRA